MNRRGISGVVATVLIILITVAAVAIVWVVILSMVRVDLGVNERLQLNVVTSDGWTFWDEDEGVLFLQIGRGADEVDLKYMQIVISVDGSSLDPILETVPGSNSEVTLKGIRLSGRPDSVGVAPVFADGVGEITSILKRIPRGVAGDDYEVYDFPVEEVVYCDEGVERCEDYSSFVCVSGAWVDMGEVDGKCDYVEEVPAECLLGVNCFGSCLENEKCLPYSYFEADLVYVFDLGEGSYAFSTFDSIGIYELAGKYVRFKGERCVVNESKCSLIYDSSLMSGEGSTFQILETGLIEWDEYCFPDSFYVYERQEDCVAAALVDGSVS